MTAAEERIWRGVFLVFEGGDGVGKTTQVARMCGLLTERGHDVVRTYEPGDTAAGRRIRDIVLSPKTGDLAPRAEALLYAADKAQHLAEVIRPALERGAVVVCDRYVDSMLAYQGAGRMLELSDVESITRWATDDVRADLTVVLDMDPALAVGEKRQQDRVEAAGDGFHARARSFFLDLAARDPDRYLVLDARLSRAEISDRILERLQPMLATTPVEPIESAEPRASGSPVEPGVSGAAGTVSS
jgi:dTMP kinase